jgi:LmbE family N-acetylglucosaminyl deacetylase
MQSDKTFSSQECISEYTRLLRQRVTAPSVLATSLSINAVKRDVARPCAVIFSPHPDDECLTGALPLRLRHEQNWQIINLALTLGSKTERRASRSQELSASCQTLGFECVLPVDEGFSDLTPLARQNDPLEWRKKVASISNLLSEIKPHAVFLPHANDAHPTHIGVHFLAVDTLASLSDAYTCNILQTEYWQPQRDPNLMIGITEADAAILLDALACHTGENARNPYDARFPAYLIDNVRRGSERVGGHGTSSTTLDFAMLYSYGLWKNGKFIPSALKRIIDAGSSIETLFG